MTTRNLINSFKELEILNEDMGLPLELVEIFNNNMQEVSTTLQALSIENNFDGFIKDDVVINPSSSTRIWHNLNTIPVSRLILRQKGNGGIEDGAFAEKYIDLYNNGIEVVTLKVAILKG